MPATPIELTNYTEKYYLSGLSNYDQLLPVNWRGCSVVHRQLYT